MSRERSRARTHGRSSAPPPLILDFRRSALTFGLSAPAGCGYTRAACASTVQYGSSQVFDLTAFAALPNVIAFGRAEDTWEYGIQFEEARTNRVPDASNYSAASWTLGGLVARSGGQPGPDNNASATRLVADAGSNYLFRGSTSLAGAHVCSQWMRPTTPPADVGLLSGGSNTVRDELLAAPAAWRRYVAPGVLPTSGTINSFGVDARANFLSFGAGARDWTVYGHQIESGDYVTSLVPTSGGVATRNATFLRVLGATWSSWLVNGRVGFTHYLRPMGARSEYSGTRYLWWLDANNHVAFNAATGVVTVTVAGATNTTSAVTWTRYAPTHVYVELGAGVSYVALLTGGVRTVPSVSGSALGSLAAGDVYVGSSSTTGHTCAWNYWQGFYAPGTRPPWAW